MFIWIDTKSGTWGDAEHLRIIDMPGDLDISDFSDAQIIQFAEMVGKPIPRGEGYNPRMRYNVPNPPPQRKHGRTKGVPNGESKYPWKTWFDGKPHVLTKGKDFKIQVSSFRSSALAAANAHGVKITTHVKGNKLTIQSYRKMKPNLREEA